VIVAHTGPPFSIELQNLTDQQVIETVLNVLRPMVGIKDDGSPEDLPTLTHYHITRWQCDPFSMGSYSYIAVGATPQHIADLAAPEGEGDNLRLFFAGEACSLENMQCVSGAYLTGVKAASLLLKHWKSKTQDPTFNSKV
jgi:monoamine oxidase